jgi:hypothetical protein
MPLLRSDYDQAARYLRHARELRGSRRHRMLDGARLRARVIWANVRFLTRCTMKAHAPSKPYGSMTNFSATPRSKSAYPCGA